MAHLLTNVWKIHTLITFYHYFRASDYQRVTNDWLLITLIYIKCINICLYSFIFKLFFLFTHLYLPLPCDATPFHSHLVLSLFSFLFSLSKAVIWTLKWYHWALICVSQTCLSFINTLMAPRQPFSEQNYRDNIVSRTVMANWISMLT